LYFKEHKEVSAGGFPPGRTLFVTNLYSDTTKEDLRNIFSEFGTVQEVLLDSFRKKLKSLKPAKPIPAGEKPSSSQYLILEEKRKRLEANLKEGESKIPFISAGYAHVIFEDPKSINMALHYAVPDIIEHSELGSEKKGVQKWIATYTTEINLDKEKLLADTHEYMLNYDKKKFEFQKRIEALASGPDEDGWITVTRGKKKSTGAASLGVAKLDKESLNKLILKEKKKYKTDFYRFQRTAKTNTHIQELRKRFEEDKKRIEKLREGRKFRPF
jgi:ribosomal RNA-processing protein 7